MLSRKFFAVRILKITTGRRCSNEGQQVKLRCESSFESAEWFQRQGKRLLYHDIISVMARRWPPLNFIRSAVPYLLIDFSFTSLLFQSVSRKSQKVSGCDTCLTSVHPTNSQRQCLTLSQTWRVPEQIPGMFFDT